MSFRDRFDGYLTANRQAEPHRRNYLLHEYSTVFTPTRGDLGTLFLMFISGTFPVYFPFWWKESLWTINFGRRLSFWNFKVKSRSHSRLRYASTMFVFSAFAAIPAFAIFQAVGRARRAMFPDDEAGAVISASVFAGVSQGLMVGLVRSLIYLDQYGPNISFPLRSLLTVQLVMGLAAGLCGGAVVYNLGYVRGFARGTAHTDAANIEETARQSYRPKTLDCGLLEKIVF